jgi:DNA-binding protein
MGFTKLEKSVLNVSALPDKVENQAQQLKATFDQAGADIKEAHNQLIDELDANTAAGNIGAVSTKTGAKTTVQAELNTIGTKLNGIDDGANKYVLPVANTIVLGGIKPDGTTIVVDAEGKATAKAADSADLVARKKIAELEIEKATVNTYLATIPTTGWTASAPFYVDITIEGMLETDRPHITPVYTGTDETDNAISEAWNKIKRATTTANGLRAYAEEAPTIEIPIQIEVVR